MGSHKRNGFKKDSFILSVDVGTTSIKCHVYDKEANIRGSCTTKVVALYPEVGHVEMDPDAIWEGFISVVKGAVQDAGVQMRQIDALGISTQRGTFTTWDRETGVPFHNFISWQDQRAADLVQTWNSSCTLKAIRGAMSVIYFLTRQERSLAASAFVFSTQHVTLRLAWVLTHYKQVCQAVAEGNCCFGTIDTWLLFKLTKGQVHATDYSNASSTGIFDSYQMCWSHLVSFIVSLPLSIFPKVENTGHDFGSTDSSVFGVPIPIMSVMADQQAAMFGECCFDVGDVKITMGTGTFMDINTGSKPHTFVAGLYPLVGWKIGSEVVYLAEGNASDTGTAIRWAQELELFADVQETSNMAYSVSNSDGVCFVPSFSGLQAPLNDPKACASLMGLKPSTTKSHLVRAILESVAFRASMQNADVGPRVTGGGCAAIGHHRSPVSAKPINRNKQLYETMLRETQIPITKIRMDGGVSSNDFVMQLTADLFGRKVSRRQHYEMSCLGAAFVAGLGIGFWRTREELKKLQSSDEAFLPQRASKGGACSPSREYIPVLQSWERALRRSMNWYKKP